MLAEGRSVSFSSAPANLGCLCIRSQVGFAMFGNPQ